jgi:hypothetical protein
LRALLGAVASFRLPAPRATDKAPEAPPTNCPRCDGLTRRGATHCHPGSQGVSRDPSGVVTCAWAARRRAPSSWVATALGTSAWHAMAPPGMRPGGGRAVVCLPSKIRGTHHAHPPHRPRCEALAWAEESHAGMGVGANRSGSPGGHLSEAVGGRRRVPPRSPRSHRHHCAVLTGRTFARSTRDA